MDLVPEPDDDRELNRQTDNLADMPQQLLEEPDYGQEMQEELDLENIDPQILEAAM